MNRLIQLYFEHNGHKPFRQICTEIEQFAKQFEHSHVSHREFLYAIDKSIYKIEGNRNGFCDNNCELCEELNCVCEYFVNKQNKKLGNIYYE